MRVNAAAIAALVGIGISCPSGAHAREPVGKSALDAIAPIGSSVEVARGGLGGGDIEEVRAAGGTIALMKDGITVGACDRVYGVTRVVGRQPGDAMDAVLRISAVAGAPEVKENRVVGAGGAQSLQFTWPTIPEYDITVIKAETGWYVTEGTFREGVCQDVP